MLARKYYIGLAAVVMGSVSAVACGSSSSSPDTSSNSTSAGGTSASGAGGSASGAGGAATGGAATGGTGTGGAATGGTGGASTGGTGGTGTAGAATGGTGGSTGGTGNSTGGSPSNAGSTQAVMMGDGGSPDGTSFNIQAMKEIFLGDTGFDGTVSPNNDDWQSFGFNVDGLHFTATNQASFHCKLQSGGDATDEVLDGNGGVDNSFGKNILPILESFASTPSATVTSSIQSGSFSVLVQLAKLGTGATYNGITAQVFAGRGSDAMGTTAGSAVPPTDQQWMDGTYVWHPYPELLKDATVTDPTMYQSTVQFPMSYMNNNVWVSGSKGDISLTLSLSGNNVSLQIHEAVVQLQYAADHKSGSQGQIGGVLTTTELVAAIKNVATSISTSFCMGGTIDSILSEITSTSDMMHDGTQDPTMLCDGISIGIGLTTENASLGDPAPASVPVDHCAGSSGG